MRPEDVVAFAAGAAAVPLWQARKKPENHSLNTFTRDEKSFMYVHDTLLAAQKKVNHTRSGTTYTKLSEDQKAEFRKGFMAFLKAERYIGESRAAQTGADWPAAALAGLFAGAVLQSAGEHLQGKWDAQANEYHRKLEREHKELIGDYRDTKKKDLQENTVKLVVHAFVWREFPRDLGKCRDGLENLEDNVVDVCFALL